MNAFNLQFFTDLSAHNTLASTDPSYVNPNGVYSRADGTSANDNTKYGVKQEYCTQTALMNAKQELRYDAFAQKTPLPKGNGTKVYFRKYGDPKPITTPLREGVTPDGQDMSISRVECTVKQYGGYWGVTDLFEAVAIDPQLQMASELCGKQMGLSRDCLIRNEVAKATNKQFANGTHSSTSTLVAPSGATLNDGADVMAIRKAVRTLKGNNAPTFSDGYYVAIIHPDTEFDLMSDPQWQYPHQYVDTAELYKGEIGRIAGVRFVESTNALVLNGADLSAASRTLTVSSWTAGTKTAGVSQTLTSADQAALVGRKVIIDGEVSTIASASANAIVLTAVPSEAPASADVVYPGEGGAAGVAVYCTHIFGKDAYGVTDLNGESGRIILKSTSSGGTSDPLEQRATVGWKMAMGATILQPEFLVELQTASSNGSSRQGN